MLISIPRAELLSYWKDAEYWVPTIAYAIDANPAVLKTMLSNLVKLATTATINGPDGQPLITIKIEDCSAPTTAPGERTNG